MKKKDMIRCFGVFICCLLLFVLPVQPALANSAQTIWSGVTSTGVIVEDENCPLVVEKEILTFDIPQFPENYYQSIEEFIEYSATVTAEYTFYNPSNYTVTATLAFPFGNMPDYGMILDREGERWAHETLEHTRQYGVQVNGESIESVLRHTYADPFGDFDLERDIPKLRDSYAKDPFFTPEMTVTEYVYEVTGLSADEGYAAFCVREDENTRRVYPDEFNGFDRDGDQLTYGCWIESGAELTVTVVGEPFLEELSWKIYENGAREMELAGTVTLSATKTTTFLDYALGEYKQGSGILESDWYNAFVDERNSNGYLENGMELSYNLMRWYEYEITLAPGERITNAVTAPIYPRINGQYEPPVYEYIYLLSPAQTWSEFGSLDIVINTPYHLISDNQQKFEKTETGYRMLREGLPEGELKFSLSSEEKPKKETPNYLLYLLMVLPYFVALAVPLVGLVLLGAWIIRLVKKHIIKKEKS